MTQGNHEPDEQFLVDEARLAVALHLQNGGRSWLAEAVAVKSLMEHTDGLFRPAADFFWDHQAEIMEPL